MSFQDKYRSIAERLLTRSVSASDGIPVEEVTSQSKEAGFDLPLALTDYYVTVGRLDLNLAHNRLASPAELQFDFEESTMVFMDENQSVCAWGISVDELGGEDPTVYQGQPDEGEWHSENCSTSQWLEVFLYLQCCWGGLEFSLDHMEPKSVMPQIQETWEKVVEHNGLTIWEKEGMLISDMGQPWCNAATNSQEGLGKLQELGFSVQ